MGHNPKKNSPTVALLTYGCSKNLVDSEMLYTQLRQNGIHVQTTDPENAQILILNTCGFIDKAKEENIEAILEAVELKKRGKIQKIIVTGCLSQRYANELSQEIPEVDHFFGTEAYREILSAISPSLKYELIGERQTFTPSHYAYVKISEGCDHPCSFCAIPAIRGKHRSRPMEDILLEITHLADRGCKEVLLIAQDTTYYGKDLYGERKLAELLQRIADVPGIEWIRIHYAYPSHFPIEVIQVMRENSKICRYLDIPLQHISDRVLKSMRRGITKRRTIELVQRIREIVPEITLRTTFIVGYPTEREEDFEELCQFVQSMRFDRVGVFTYSQEEGTASEILGDPISLEEKERRAAKLMEIQKQIVEEKNKVLVGQKKVVLIDEQLANGEYIGRTEGDSPEVDQVVFVRSDGILQPGNFIIAEIEDAIEYDLFARCSTVLQRPYRLDTAGNAEVFC